MNVGESERKKVHRRFEFCNVKSCSEKTFDCQRIKMWNTDFSKWIGHCMGHDILSCWWKTYPNMSALTDSGALMKILVCPSWYWSWSMFTERRRCSTPCFSSPRHVGHDSFVRIAYLRQRKREKMRKLSPFGEWNHIWLKDIFFIHIKVQNAQLSLLKWSPV